jgi:V/A-type H+-transporting ATPase subunit I
LSCDAARYNAFGDNRMGLLSPEKMIIAKVVSHRDLERRVLLALEEYGSFEFIDVRRQAGLMEVKRTRDEETVFSALDRIDKMVNMLELSSEIRSGKLLEIDDSTLQNSLNLASEVIGAIENEVLEIDTELTVARNEIDRQHGIKAIAASLQPLGINPSFIRSTDFTFTIAGLIPSGRQDELEWSLNEVTNGAFVLKSVPIKSGPYASVITVSIELKDAVERILTALEFESFTIPDGESGKPEQIIQNAEQKMLELEGEIQNLTQRKNTIASEWKYRILAAWEDLSIERKRIEIKTYIVYTDQSIKMWGWIPENKESQLDLLLHDRVGSALQVTFDKPEFADHEAPTCLSNPSIMQPTEDVVKAFGVPSRHDLDPTKIMWLSFPIIFGLIFSDVGQGFLVILIGLAALRAKKKGQSWGAIMGYVQNGAEGLILMGIFAMIGGFLFGSFFGSETVIEPLWPIFAHSVAGIDNAYRDAHMLKLSIEVGAIHISLGIFLNLYNKLKHKEYKSAITAATYLILYLGFINLIFGVSYNTIGDWFSSSGNVYLWIPIVGIGYGTGNNGVYPALPVSPLIFSIGLFILPLIIMAIFSFMGGMDNIVILLENVIGIISHTVSYARIFALNTVHVILSSVFMELPAVIMITFPALELFGVEIIPHEFIINGAHVSASIPLLGAIIGTIIVGMLEGLLGFMHTLRLHYVEWFSKFYHAGGIEFKPFRAKRLHTVQVRMESAQTPYVYG